ncbi:adenosylcobinamide-GDP ribazoletransferase [uncultured Sphingomonas sp.]|uniref:adenosylcobinamide-GDP ribazoletransferase n=1 Tax=uncultured Sphingomonas sp. TaxID=158754 RepID=UPI0026129E72|nr:adenosylcobinamide-GDP ribazoletransferase [uncultured Sphingomonas sp.]
MSIRAPFWAPPLMAVQFLTRVPVPWLARLDSARANDAFVRSTGWLPLVGSGIGCVTAILFTVGQMWWPPLLALLVALAVEAWLTGAFHEDAVADFCDAFGGVRDAETTRRIMKDSRIGSYGTLGLGLALALRVAATLAVPGAVEIYAIVAAAGIARWCAVLLMAMAPPAATGGGVAKDIGRLPRRSFWLAAVTVLPAFTLLAATGRWTASIVLVVIAAMLVWIARGVRRRIGGSTGDCLGFAAYAGQVVVLLVVAGA